MFEYLEKFKNLSADLKAIISTPEVLKATADLEKKYNVDLAITIMRVMVKEIKLDEIPLHLFTDLALGQAAVDTLTIELKEQVFAKALDYLQADDKKVIAPEPVIITPKVVVPEIKPEAISEPEIVKEIDEEIAVEAAMPEMKLDEYSARIYEAIEKIVEEFNVGGEHLMKFQDAIKLYLREIRSRIDTRAFLLKAIQDGGLGLSDLMVDKILSRADALRNEINVSLKKDTKPSFSIMDKINELNKMGADRDVSYDLSKILDLKHELKGGLDLSHEIAAPTTAIPNMEIAAPVVVDKKIEAPIAPITPVKATPISLGAINPAELLDAEDILPSVKNVDETPILSSIPSGILDSALASIPKEPFFAKTELAPKPIAEVKATPIMNKVTPVVLTPTPTPAPSSSKFIPGKVKIEDIKSIKTMSPIDELLYMDLVNFRRLGISVDEIMEKIKDRVELMRADDYEKGLAAIAAWRRSPVSKLYLKILSRATSEDKTIPAVIEDLKNSKQDYLSMDEIEGIIMLNNRLRF
ncbi:MAG: hypothetical protein WCK37_00580 [Candidatus Falkowbacteria bacterium]